MPLLILYSNVLCLGEEDMADLEETQLPTHKPPLNFSRCCALYLHVLSICIYIPAAEDAIIQPINNCCCDDEEDILQVSFKKRLAMKRKSIYEKYCTESQPMYIFLLLVYTLSHHII